MKVAVIATHVGSPGTLASTAFVRSLMEGLTSTGVSARVIGLARHPLSWLPETLDPYETALPWLGYQPIRFSDVREAADIGLFDSAPWEELSCPRRTAEWHLELLLERSLQEFAGDDPDLVIMVYPRVLSILRGIARISLRRPWRFVVISTEALTDAQIDPSSRAAYIHCAGDRADGAWVLSAHLADFWASHGMETSRILVNPPGVRQDAFAARVAPERDRVLYIGNLEHREIAYLLDISEMVSQRVPDYHLEIYADSTDAKRDALRQSIAARNLASVVSVEEPVSPQEVPRVLARAHVLVLPRSLGEFSTAGFPNKLGEYLASGRPVVVTAVGDIPKYLTDGVSAFLVEPDNPPAFADRLVAVMADAETAERVAAAGREVARSLSSPMLGARLSAFFQQLPKRHLDGVTPRGRRWRSLRAFMAIPALNVWNGIVWLARKLGLNRSGQYGLVAARIVSVRVLRFLRLWPPAPSDRPHD